MRLVPRAPSLRERRNLFEGYSFFFDLRNSPIDLATGHLAFRLVANTGAADTGLNKILNHLRWKEQDVAMAQHCALRGAGRARCVDEQYQLLGRRGVDEFVPQLRIRSRSCGRAPAARRTPALAGRDMPRDPQDRTRLPCGVAGSARAHRGTYRAVLRSRREGSAN